SSLIRAARSTSPAVMGRVIVISLLVLHGHKPDQMGGCGIDRLTTEEERHIIPARPWFAQVCIRRRAGIPRLAGRVDAYTVVPGTDIHHQPNRSTGVYTEVA